MAEAERFDLVVIGGGPAGYVGAIRAAQLGMTAACVERDRLGGVCLNWGCIPTKALLAAAEFYAKLKHEASDFGIMADNIRHDWEKVIGRSRRVTGVLNHGIESLFKKNKITHIEGGATIPVPGAVEVRPRTGDPARRIGASHVLIATGAEPRAIPGCRFDGDRIITSKEAMVLSEQPRKLLIVGAGAIGMEFAYFYKSFGTEVVMVEMLDHLLPNEDEEISRAIERSWRKLKIEVHLRTKPVAVNRTMSGVELTVAAVDDDNRVQKIVGDKVLIAVGVKGRYDGLFDDHLGIRLEHEHIKVDRTSYQTDVPGIYAVGDVIGPPSLAHVASEEAVNCVERIAGHRPTPIDYDAIPACTYCHPQVASLGLTEQTCKNRGLEYRAGKFPFQASGKAHAIGFTEGFVKIVTDARHGEVLGVHMIGENVTELLAEMGLAKRVEATAAEVISTMHAHPTLSEAVHEASLGVEGRMVHF